VVKKIHACPNHCILFRGDTFKDLDKCPRCGASRYKDNCLYSGGEASTRNKKTKKGTKKAVQESQPPEDTPLGNDARKRRVPVLVMWYLPVTDRLRRIFLNPKEATLITWWDDDRKVDDDVIAHSADGSQWKDFDDNNKLFSSDPRNVRFALSTDGMNPFNERMSDHSTWLVILTMYNIPTWLCQKRKYLFLTVLISGPRQLGIDIDVFLEPMMQEFERLWKFGEPMYDAF
jgi:phage FluMu protein Com